jgi:acyl-CoA thioesterase I
VLKSLHVTTTLRGLAIATLLIVAATPGHAASLNIVALGASNTAGWGVGEAKSFPAQLQAILKERGVDAAVINAGIPFDTTSGMLRRVDSVVAANTHIVILQPGGNDVRFGSTKEQRAANIAAIAARLRARNIRVIVFDPVIPADHLQWDGIHYTAEAHGKFAKSLAAQIGDGKPR